MAIRQKQRANGKISYLVYWINPYTSKQESKLFHDEQEAKKYNSLIKHKIKFDNEEFKPIEYVRENNNLTIEDCFFLYLKEKQYTEKYTAQILTTIKVTLENFGHIQLSKLDKNMFEEIKCFLQNTKYVNPNKKGTISQTFAYHQLSRLRAMLNWSYEKGYIEKLPIMKAGSPNYQKFIPPTIEEIQALIEVSPIHLIRVIILGAYIGLRVGESELLSLTWDKVDLLNAFILIDTSKKNKNQAWRQVPIRTDLLPLFKQWHEDDKQNNINHLVTFEGKQVKSIKTAWRTASRNANITRIIRPYDLRHTFATQLIKEGVDVGTVANLMGHSSPQMIYKHYQHVLTEQKRSAVESLPKINYMTKKKTYRKVYCKSLKYMARPKRFELLTNSLEGVFFIYKDLNLLIYFFKIHLKYA